MEGMFHLPRWVLLRLFGHQSACERWWMIAFQSLVSFPTLRLLNCLYLDTQVLSHLLFLFSSLSWGQGMSKHCRMFSCWQGPALHRLLHILLLLFLSLNCWAWHSVEGNIPLADSGQLSGCVHSQLLAHPIHCRYGSAVVKTLMCCPQGVSIKHLKCSTAWSAMKKINSIPGRSCAVVILVAVSWDLSPKMCNSWCMAFTLRVMEHWKKLPERYGRLHTLEMLRMWLSKGHSSQPSLTLLWAEGLG